MKTLIRFISITNLTRNTKHNLIIHNHITRSYSNEKQPISIASTVSSPSPDGVSAIDAGTSMRKPISLWPGMYHSPVTNALWQARNVIFDNAGGCVGNGVVNKSPGDSRTTILYPFSTDYILREQYRNPWNGIRVGKLLEDLDALAGTISFKVSISLFCVSFIELYYASQNKCPRYYLASCQVKCPLFDILFP